MSPFSSLSSSSSSAAAAYPAHPDLLDPDLPDATQDLFSPGPSRRATAVNPDVGTQPFGGNRDDLMIDRDSRDQTAMRKEGWSSSSFSNTPPPDQTSSNSRGPVKGKGKQRATLDDNPGERSSYATASRSGSGVGSEDEEGEPMVGPLGAKALASITGAVTTSLLMTPFDVLKTRLQTNLPRSSPLSQTSSNAFAQSGGLGGGSVGETVCCQTAVLPEVVGGGGRLGGGGVSGGGPAGVVGGGVRSILGASGSNGNGGLVGSVSGATEGAIRSTCLSSTISTGTNAIASSSKLVPTSIPTSFIRRFLPNPQATSSTSASSFIPSFVASTSSSGTATLVLPTSAPAGCLHPSKWAGIWGESGSAAITQREAQGLLLANAQRVATMDVVGQAGSRGFFSEIGVVMREGQGVRGLWKGVGTSLTMSIPSASLYMIGYEHLLTILAPMMSSTPPVTSTQTSPTSPFSSPAPPSSTSQPYFTPAPFVAGSLARTLSATVISPMELFRVRLQALPAAGQPSPTYKSTFDSIVLMVKGQGVRALWRGLGPTLWRDVPFSGAYWANFEILKKYLTESGTLEPGLRMTFISGATSGTIASVITSPFDVLKTRRQAFTPSASCSPAAVSHPASTLPLLLHIVETEGWRALFAGIVPRTAKIAPACGIMIGCYEGVGRYLGGKQGSRL